MQCNQKQVLIKIDTKKGFANKQTFFCCDYNA